MMDNTKDAILSSRCFIVESLTELDGIIDYLLEKKAITFEDKERIECCGVRSDKIRKLLDILHIKSNTSRQCFIDVLKNSAENHIYEYITNRASNCQSSKSSMTSVRANWNGQKLSYDLTTCSQSEQMYKPLDQWTVEYVIQWLKSLNFFLPDQIVSDFKTEEIDGKALMHLTCGNIREYISPKTKMGYILKIIAERDKLLQKDSLQTRIIASIPPVRSQDSSDMSITYQESSYLKTKTGLHEFLMPEPRINDSREQIEWLQKKIMAFVCACANERTNGTIHIGADDKSKIIGMSGNKDAMKSAIEDAVSIHFFEDEASRIKKCITRIAFIPVTGNNADQFVLEVDVGPSFEYCEDVIFWYIEREEKMDVLRFVDGHPVVVPNEEIQILRKEIKSRAREQEQIEDQQRDSYLLNTTDDPVEKLKVLLSQKNVTRNMSPILVIDALPEKPTTEDMKSQFQFLKEWDWEYVFDFDSDETLYCYLDNEEQQVLSVLPVDDFNPEAKESSEYVNKQFTLSDSSRVWLYSNGSCSLDRKPQNVRDWKQRRGKQFREVVRLLKTQITNDRVVVVFMLFSTKLDVILEAADELITEFPNKWFAISETEDVMDAWKTGLCQKHLASQPMELLPVSVTGLRWADVNNVVRTFSKKIPCREISIPSEHGYVAVTEKTLNELTDLEIVSSLTYDVAALTEEKRHQFQVDSENAFYRGGQATWWNFCFNQVIDRNAVASLVEDIEKQMVEAVEDDRVAVVELHHQPGAGGTTVAKHVLWKLRDKCRCIVVRNITDQTVAQIEMVHRYKTDLPRPVLVLFDNKDEEAIDMLRFSLEERNSDAREWEFDSERHLFFVFLCTKRYSNIDSSQRHYLKQEMASNELHRFQERYTELTKKFKETSDPWLNPKHLISFNIMKENFSEEYIRTTVSSLVEDIEISKEIKLLAYTAMINTFDVYFQPLPLSAFDPLMRIPLDCSIGFFQSWEEYLTPSMNTLLTREYDSSETSSVHFRIIHGVVSKIIHDQLIKRNYKLMKDLFVEFINSVVLDSRSRSTQRLVRIVCDVMKKRISNPKSGKPERFSPFIQCIISESENGKRNAEEILYNIFEISGDVFVGQQLARLYIFCGQWDKARITSKKIVNARPDNSFLWDTYGLSYLTPLRQMFSEIQHVSSVEPIQIKEIIILSLDAIEIFQKMQQICQREKVNHRNSAVYFHELETIENLLHCLSFVDGLGISNLQLVLSEVMPMPDFITRVIGDKAVKVIGNSQKRADLIVTCFEECLVYQQQGENSQTLCKLNEIRAKIGSYFVCSHSTSSLSPRQQCIKRRGEVDKLIGKTYSIIFRVTKEDRGQERLKAALGLLQKNIESEACTLPDINRCLSVTIALCYIDRSFCKSTNGRSDFSKLAYSLYQNRSKIPYQNLEPYFFAAALNWPSGTCMDQCMTAGELRDLLENWRKAYNTESRSGNIQLLFLGRKQGMERYIFYDQLQVPRKRDLNESDQCVTKLEWFTGTLEYGGKTVLFQLADGENSSVTIKINTYRQGRNRSQFNKTVYFAVVFTWSGPKAVGMCLEDPRCNFNNLE